MGGHSTGAEEQERNALALVLILTLETDRVIFLWDFNERDGFDVASMDCRQTGFFLRAKCCIGQ